ncbi:unnamed protein product, partial [Ectocarpus sp. 6 AP-2014]
LYATTALPTHLHAAVGHSSRRRVAHRIRGYCCVWSLGAGTNDCGPASSIPFCCCQTQVEPVTARFLPHTVVAGVAARQRRTCVASTARMPVEKSGEVYALCGAAAG